MITITIPGDPIPQKRHATYHRGDKCCAYDPQKKDKERTKAYLPRERPFPDGTPLRVTSKFFVIPCASSTAQEREDKLSGKLHPTKFDLDNLEKYLYDCCNDIIWDDDRHITTALVKKRYAEVARTEITVERDDLCT